MVTIYSSLTEHGIHVMDSFEFEYGRILNDLEVEYSTYGVPKYDEDGYITNAILFSSTFRGIYSFLAGMHEYILNNGYFGDEFYIILIRSLGTPDSCSPSSTGLNNDFPKYTVRDQVNFRRQFLFEKFKIKKVLGLVGEGIGAFQFLEWTCDYPDEMKFLLIINSAANVSGYRFILSKTFESIIDSADNSDDEYGISKNNAVVAINALLFAHSSSKTAFSKLDNDEITVIFEDFADECFFRDMYDFKFRNECDMEFDVIDKLPNIKAKSLFIGTNTNYFHSDFDMIPFKELVKDSEVLIEDTVQNDYYFKQEDYKNIGDKIISFLDQFLNE